MEETDTDKTNYVNKNIGIEMEIIIYDEKYKDDVTYHVNKINNFPVYVTFPLIILKILFYRSIRISASSTGKHSPSVPYSHQGDFSTFRL